MPEIIEVRNIVEGDDCPGMVFLQICKEIRSSPGNPMVRGREYPKASLPLCGVCRCCTVMKRRSDGKIVVKCEFGRLQQKADRDMEFFKKLKSLWKLRLDVLDDKITVGELESYRKEIGVVNEEEHEENEGGDKHER